MIHTYTLAGKIEAHNPRASWPFMVVGVVDGSGKSQTIHFNIPYSLNNKIQIGNCIKVTVEIDEASAE